MTAAVILNIVFATLVVAGILSLLGWAIVTDQGWHSSRPAGRQLRTGLRISRRRRRARVAGAATVSGRCSTM